MTSVKKISGPPSILGKIELPKKSGNSMLFIFDLDQTIVDSDIALELRNKGKWSEVYHVIPKMSLFPHIKEVIELIQKQNHSVAVVTSSPRKYCEKVLENFGLEIENVIGYHDTKNKKPHPEPILKAISNTKVEKENVISIGDNIDDLIASKGAGVKAIGCTWGHKNKKTDFHNYADFVFDSTSDFKSFLEVEYLEKTQKKISTAEEKVVTIKVEAKKLSGPIVLGKIELPKGKVKTTKILEKDKQSEELLKVQQERNEIQEKYLRLFSEYENYRKRAAKEKIKDYENFRKRAAKDKISLYKYQFSDSEIKVIKDDHKTYTGPHKNNLPHGYGSSVCERGNFQGMWKDGKRNGHGYFDYNDGDKYVGEWKDGKENGQGTYTWANGRKYVGEYKDGKKNGQGTFTSANGDKYVGEWKDGKKNGQGTYTWADGRKYVGEWKDGKQIKKKFGKGAVEIQNQKLSDFLNKNVSFKYKSSGIIESSYSCYYIPKKYREDIYDEISSELLSFKDGNSGGIEFWKKIVIQEFENKSYDYVVRVLSSKELKAEGRKSLDDIGETIASITGSNYIKSVLRKNRSTEQLKFMNKQERENEILDVYEVYSDLNLSNKKVLIIDDVTTTGTTIKAVAKALKTHTQSIKLYSYCLCKTSDDINANANFKNVN